MSALFIFNRLLLSGLNFLPFQHPIDSAAKAQQSITRFASDAGLIVKSMEKVAHRLIPLHHRTNG